MSQASKQVNWCIKKTKKELEECQKQGKRPKHRGLKIITPDENMVKQHLEKAIHNFSVVQLLIKEHFSD